MKRHALMAAIGASVVGAGLLVYYLRTYEQRVSGGAPVNVLIAVQDLPLNSVLSETVIGTRVLPSAYVQERHILASEASKILGIRLATSLKAQEPVLWTDLAATTEHSRQLSTIIESGKRGVTVQADVRSMFGGLLQPGNRVDVFVSAGSDESLPVTKLLLQRMLVLAVGADLGQAEEGGSRTNAVTLSASMREASILTNASLVGMLTLVLRNPDDIAEVKGFSEVHGEQVLGIKKPRPVTIARPREEGPQLPTQLN